MAKINFGGTVEEVVTREEFPMEKALEIMKNETIAIIGYGVQGPAQALNLRDNGFNVIVGQRKGSKTWDKAVQHGWVPGETLFEIEEAVKKGTIIQFLYQMRVRLHCGQPSNPILQKARPYTSLMALVSPSKSKLELFLQQILM